MRIFVCSPLRGPDGQPSEKNIALARRLMRAVFDAGHSPFVPHLLYPQVLSERPEDLKRAFEANYSFLSVCDEIWVFAKDKESCSRGMRAEVEWCERYNFEREKTLELLEAENHFSGPEHFEEYVSKRPKIEVRFMPEAFQAPHIENKQSGLGICNNCGVAASLSSGGRCMDCFSGVTR